MSKSDGFLTVAVDDSTRRSAADGVGKATLLLSGPAGSSQEEPTEKSLKEALFLLVDIVVLMGAFGIVWSMGLMLSGVAGFGAVVFGMLRLLGIAFQGNDADGVFALEVGAALLTVALVSWRISDPLGTLLERKGRALFGKRYIEPEALQSASRWLVVLKSRVFAAIDVVGAGITLVVLAAVMGASAYCFLLFIPLPGVPVGEGSLGGSLGIAAFFALTFLISWRFLMPLKAFCSRRWDVVVAVGEKAP